MPGHAVVFINNFDPKKSSKTARKAEISRIRTHAAKTARQRSRNAPKSINDDVEKTKSRPPQDSMTEDSGEIELNREENSDLTTCVPLAAFGFYRSELLDLLPCDGNREMASTVDQWIYSPRNFYNRRSASVEVQPLASVTLQSMADDRLIFLLTFTDIKAWADRLRGFRSTPPDLLTACQIAILSCVRRRVGAVKPEMDLNLIFAVALLALHEKGAGRHKQYDLHWSTFTRLVRLRHANSSDAEFDNLYTKAMRFFFALDAFPMLPQRPTEVPGIPTCPFSVDLHPVIRSLPLGFRALVLANHLSFDLALVLSQTVAVLQKDKQEAITMCCTTQHGSYRDYLEACIDLSYPESSLERFVCLALMLLRAILFHEVRMGKYLMHMPRLQLALHLKDIQVDSVPVRKCLIWLYMIAMDGWRDKTNTGLLPPGILLLKEFRATFGEDVSNWTQVQTILGDFFWPKPLQEWWRRAYDLLKQFP